MLVYETDSIIFSVKVRQVKLLIYPTGRTFSNVNVPRFVATTR